MQRHVIRIVRGQCKVFLPINLPLPNDTHQIKMITPHLCATEPLHALALDPLRPVCCELELLWIRLVTADREHPMSHAFTLF